jgi:exportin-7
LNMWQFAPNSIHYLLSLWQRMVASVPYVKATEPHLLETYTPEVTQAYITSRLESVAAVTRYWPVIQSAREPQMIGKA